MARAVNQAKSDFFDSEKIFLRACTTRISQMRETTAKSSLFLHVRLPLYPTLLHVENFSLTMYIGLLWKDGEND